MTATTKDMSKMPSGSPPASQQIMKPMKPRLIEKFSSNMPDVYISRAGMETKQLDERFTQTELATVQNDLAKMEQVAKIEDDRIQQLEDSVRLLQQNLDAVSKVLRLNPRVEDVKSAPQRKKEEQG